MFTSDDTPFEEVLHIRLLNRRLDTIDAVELKQIYHPGLLSHLRVLDDFNLTFSFFGNDCWCLSVDPQASVRWNFKPFASVHYPGWPLGSHHLKLVKCRAPLAS